MGDKWRLGRSCTLAAARDRGDASLDALALEAAAGDPVRAGTFASYLRHNLRYTFGPREQAGLERFHALAAEVDKRVNSIKAMGGQFGEGRLLLLASLLLADEVHDLKVAVAQARASTPAAAEAEDPRLAERLARIADRIEGIAQTLDRA